MRSLSFDGSQPGTPVGYYTYTVHDDHWSWSDGVFELHGYQPRSVTASTELLLHHKHPDDMARAFEVLENAVRDGEPYSCYHRIIDADGKIRSVLSVGRGSKGSDGQVEQLTGFFVDLTEARRAEVQTEVEEALRRIAETRSTIEQAKGIIMAAVGCDATEAFGVLRHHSSHKNVKLNELAHRLVDAVQSRPSLDGGSDVLALLEGLESPSRTAG